jgi:hypothetical protein
LSTWLDDRYSPRTNGQVYSEALATGAVIFERFEARDGDPVEWELVRRLEGRDATHLRPQVR